MRKNFLLLAICCVMAFNVSLVSAATTTKKAPEETAAVSSKPISLDEAMAQFKNLSRKERKERIKDAKNEIKKFKAEKEAGSEPNTNTLLLVILALFIPPLAVYLHQGEINTKFWISLILTLLFFIPGVIYSLIVILGGA